MNKIHVCFFLDDLNHTFAKFSSSLQPIFNACCNDNNFKISILKESNNISNTFNDFLNNLNNKIKVYTYFVNNTKLDLKRLNIDYMFTMNPYYQSHMNWDEWGGKFKLCLKLYGVYCDLTIIEDDRCQFKKQNIFKQSDFVFCDSHYHKQVLSEYWKNDNKFIVSGSPNFDYILKNKTLINQNLWKLDKNKVKNVKRIIWSPHHSIKLHWLNNLTESNSKSFSNNLKGYSFFLEYCDLWLKIPKLYPQLDIIMKPHPILFKNLETQTNGEWNQNKINNWKNNFLDNPNTQILEDGTYDDLFLTSDAIINDSISFVAEYLPTLKPFLLCTSPETPKYNTFGKNITNSYYKAYCEQDIINFIENVVIGNNDPMYQDRKRAMKENIFVPNGGSGKFIKNYIKKDWYDNNPKAFNTKNIFNTIESGNNI